MYADGWWGMDFSESYVLEFNGKYLKMIYIPDQINILLTQMVEKHKIKHVSP